jgi:hypothetical protein
MESHENDSTPEEPEIESFNLADLDVSPLDVRLELTSLLPQAPHPCTNIL